MALPKIELPIFELALPSNGEKIKYRPFTVKEEKILLVAQQSHDATQEVIAVKQIVNNCLIDKDISELAMFDLEFIMLALRSKSIDNNIEFAVKDPDTEETVKLTLDIENVTVLKNPEHTNQIKINETYTLFLKYPTIDEYIKISELDQEDPLVSYFMMVSCLDQVASEDEVYNLKDYTQKEIDTFVEDFSADVIKKIQDFFETMPKVRHELKYKNKNGDEKTFVIEGMRTFFT